MHAKWKSEASHRDRHGVVYSHRVSRAARRTGTQSKMMGAKGSEDGSKCRMRRRKLWRHLLPAPETPKSLA